MQIETPPRDGLHVAIIMDGNGRWATGRGLPRAAGHRAGINAVRRVVRHAPEVGVRCLTLYAFSSDNWRRPMLEVESIFWLLRAYLRLERHRLRAEGVRLEVIGRRDRLPPAALREIQGAEAHTADGQRLHLRLAIDYSSRHAIARAALDLLSAPRSPAGQELQAKLAHRLCHSAGELDLLIRTGGEQRLSDFLLWEAAYAELLFTPRLWPDFTPDDLGAALRNFHTRIRRFGALPDLPSSAETAAEAASA